MTRVVSVPTISCEHCKTTIEGALRPRPDVARAEVDVNARTVSVEGAITDDALRAALAAVGYDVAP